MAIAYVSVGGTSFTTTQNYPTTVAAGELLIWSCSSKYDPNFVVPPGDWTLITQYTSGAGTGNAVGAVSSSHYYKIANGTESAGTFTVTATSVNSFFGRVTSLSKASNMNWSIAAVSGDYTGAGTAWSATTGSIALTSGDFLVVVSSGNNSAATYTAEAFGAVGGATLSALTERGDSGTSGGDDTKLVICTGSVTAGSATSTLTYTMTGTAAASGGTSVIRLREITPAVDTLTTPMFVAIGII